MRKTLPPYVGPAKDSRRRLYPAMCQWIMSTEQDLSAIAIHRVYINTCCILRHYDGGLDASDRNAHASTCLWLTEEQIRMPPVASLSESDLLVRYAPRIVKVGTV